MLLLISGAFLVTYFIMLVLMGMPIFLLELIIGQYSGLGPDQAFTKMAPIFAGLGYCTLVVISLITVYYMVIIAWTVFYFFASFTTDLGFGSCDNSFNTLGKRTNRCTCTRVGFTNSHRKAWQVRRRTDPLLGLT